MSIGLLEKVSGHLKDAGLMTGLDDKYYQWKDSDLTGKADFVLFQMAGTSGIRNATVQSPDVRLLIVGKKDKIRETNDKADAIFANFAGMTKPAGILKFEPIGTVMGAYFLDNGRAVFEVVVRCFVQDM